MHLAAHLFWPLAVGGFRSRLLLLIAVSAGTFVYVLALLAQGIAVEPQMGTWTHLNRLLHAQK